MLKNFYMKSVCCLISLSIKCMPSDWQTDKAIKNLISTGAIKTIKSA